MFHIVLVEPEIPPNTGNVARTCALTGTTLHLVKPLGFSLDDKYVKRAGLDYWHLLDLHIHESLADFLALYGDQNLYLATTKGAKTYSDFSYKDGDFFLFGKETAGLPESLRQHYADQCIKVPMISHPAARSLNLANTAAIVLYEALRQNDFAGL